MADPQAPNTPSLAIEKIYVKDLSLENPGAPQSFLSTEAPSVEVGLRTRGEQVDENVFECVLTITVTAKAGDKTLFLVEAAQAGLFRIQGVPMADMEILTLTYPEAIALMRELKAVGAHNVTAARPRGMKNGKCPSYS